MSADRKHRLFWLRARSLTDWPGWWWRLLLCVGAFVVAFLILIGSESAGLMGPVSTYGALATVAFVLLMGPSAARPGSDALLLSRPVGRIEEVHRRAVLIAGVALCCGFMIGAFAFVGAPEFFGRREIKLDAVGWWNNSKSAFVGLDVAKRPDEEQACFDKWYSVRWGGSAECNDRAKEVFNWGGPEYTTFILVSAEERDCIKQWAEAEQWQFVGMLDKPSDPPDANQVVTGVSAHSFHGTRFDKLALEASTLACEGFGLELSEGSDRLRLLIADDPEIQPCFAHWQQALGREPTCSTPWIQVPAQVPPVGLLLVASFVVALFASAMLRTALAPAGPGRAFTVTGVALVLAAPIVPTWFGYGSSARVVFGCALALAVGTYVVARARWAKGDFP